MAATIEHQDERAAGKKGPSLLMFLVVLAVISLIAGGAGFGVSATMLSPASLATGGDPTPIKTKITRSAGAEAAAGHGAADEPAEPPQRRIVVDLPSITTNLIDPPDVWIRLELSLVFEGETDLVMAEDIHQDILAYVHTMKLYNLRGGSGYQHLMQDLGERAAIRSQGEVRRVLVRSLILE